MAFGWDKVIGAGIGAVGSILGGNKAADGASDAADATADASRYSADLNKQIYDQGRLDSSPYAQLGAVSAPLLQYYATGIMPQLSQYDQTLIDQYNGGGAGAQPLGYDDWYAQNNYGGGPQLNPAYTAWQGNTGNQGSSNIYGEGGFDRGPEPQQYIGPGSPQTGYEDYLSGYNSQQGDVDQFGLQQALARQQGIAGIQDGGGFQASPYYDWQRDQATRGINAAASAKGLSGSTASLNALGNAYNALGASEVDRSYGRLLDLSNTGMGIGAQNLGAGQVYAGNAGQAMQVGATREGLFNTQAANTTGSLYQNLGQGVGQMVSDFGSNQQQAPSPYGSYDPSGFQSNNWMGR
jgi:hypothetical protein